jgi:branched-chain amino acid transport system ATP-binding protein
LFFEAKGVTVRFGGLTANNNVSVSFDKGCVMGLIGPNGAGKSTFFKCCNGFNVPSGGEVFFQGKRISGRSTWDICKEGLTSTFQLAETFPEITVMETALIGAYCRAATEKEAYGIATETLNFMNLLDVKDKYNRELSLYTRKRVEICAALATRPQLLLLDEIFAGCTLNEDEELIDLVRRLNKEKGISIFLVEHVLKVVHELCDRVVVLENGEMIAQGSPAEVTQLPKVITAYLGEDYANA